MQRQQMLKPKAEQGKISKKEFERQLGISVFLSIVCSLVAFIPVTVLIQMFLGDIPGLFAISAIITYGFFQTIFYKMAQAGKFKNLKWSNKFISHVHSTPLKEWNKNPLSLKITNIFNNK